MRIPICILALVVSSWSATAADVVSPADVPAPAAETTEQAPQAPAEPAKPADAPPPAPPAKYGGWVFSGLADAYVTRNGNKPTGDLNGLQNFDLHSGAPRFSLGKFTIDKSDKVLGIHVDVGVGETMRLIHATDVAAQEHKGLRYFEQMYAIFKPNHAHGTEIVWGSHTLSNIGLTAALTKAKYTWSTNYYEGASDFGKNVGKRNLVDSTILLTPNSKFNAYINGDWARNNRFGGGYDQWYGLAGAARYQLTKIFAVAARTEFFNDANGFSTGVKQTLKEGTATGEAKLNDHLVGRLEFRHDSSDHAFFDRGKLAPNKSQNTLTLGIVALLGPLK